MFGHLRPTPYDLRFSLFGIPVRVHPVFWLTAAVIVWNWAGGRIEYVLVGILCVFASILVHELGHALTTRYFGWTPEIVLEFFGGYATTARHSTGKDILVLLAGPGAGFLLFFGVLGFDILRRANGTLEHPLVDAAVQFLLWANLLWNGVNLLPVFPLDGGQIARLFFSWLRPRQGLEIAVILSIVASGAVTFLAIRHIIPERRALFGLDPIFLALIFGYLCYRSVQEYQLLRGGPW